MFGGKSKHGGRPIGLDVGEDAVRLLQLSPRGAAAAAAQAPLPAGVSPGGEAYHAAVSKAVGEALREGGFAGSRVISALPASALQCKNLRLPVMPADELASAVRWEAADRFGYAEKKISSQFLVAGEVRQGEEQRQEIILLATKLDFVEAHVASLVENRLRLQAIDVAPAALARLGAPGADAPGVRVVLDVGRGATQVLIVQDGRVLFYKPIEIGVARLEAEAAGALNLSLDQARQRLEASDTDTAGLRAVEPALGELGREIGLCLRYYGVTFRGPRPETAALVGRGAAPWLAGALGAATGLGLETDDALGGIDLSAVRGAVPAGTEHRWAVAAGLSLRGGPAGAGASPEATAGGVAA